MSYGPHLALDVSGCKPGSLSDLALIASVLNELPDLIDMIKICPPYVFRYDDPNPEESGITGGVYISTSHLTIHTYEKKDYFFFDIFSCKPFDTDKVIDYIRDKFEAQKIISHLIERGEDFPR